MNGNSMGTLNGDALKEPLLGEEAADLASEVAGKQLALKPVQPLSLAWQNISLTIPNKAKKGQKNGRGKQSVASKQILHDVSGEAPSGAVTAIMGPTGSGKSSLLNALAGRVNFIKGAKLEGQLLVNGEPIDGGLMPKLCAYVVQDDVLYSFLTVRETLTLAAHFYLSSNMSTKDKEAYVHSVINALGLAKAIDTIIGDNRVRGVSGGERKRVSVGIELISNPSLLFLDEPTSGLDSFQALSVMGAMRALARSGRTVIAAIHQPRSSIFDMLDLLVLVSEGSIMYAGSASQAVDYFAKQGLECPPRFNPSDFFLDVISMDYRSPELEQTTRSRIEQLGQAWLSTTTSSTTSTTAVTTSSNGNINRISTANGSSNGEADGSSSNLPAAAASSISTYQSSWFTQFVMLFVRGFKQAKRNKFALTVKTASSVFFALVLGAIYSRHVNPPGQKEIQNYIGALFFVSINQAFGNLQGVIQIFPLEKHIVQKERAAKAYHLSAYYLAKILSELPFTLLGPLLFSSIAYWIVGLNAEIQRFFIFIGLCLMEATCAVSLGMVVSAFAPDVPSATALAPPMVIVFLLFSGVFINVSSLPKGAQWCPYMSFVKWAFNSFAQNQFRGLMFTCPDDPTQGCIKTGEEVLSLYSMDEYEVWQCVLALAGITTIFIFLGFIILRLTSPKYLHMQASSSAFPKALQGLEVV